MTPTASQPPDLARTRLAELLPGLRARYAVRALWVFGSYARGEQTAESDLDILAEFDRTPDLYALGEMVLDL